MASAYGDRMPGLRWSAPARADDDAWLALLAAIERVDRRGETYTADDLDDEWASVWADPEHDAMFVWDGDALVAFAWNKAMPGERDANKVACWGGVHPAHRGRGVGRQLLEWQVERGRAAAATFHGELPTRIELDALTTHADLLALAQRTGFEQARVFLEVVRPAMPIEPLLSPSDLELADWDERFDEPTRLAHAEAFADHWGIEPRTPDAWRQWYTGHRAFRPDLSVVALAGGDVVGFVLCAAYPQDWAATPREAWINSVGTRPGWRGRGVARWLLVEVLGRIAAAGDRFERSILGVDDANASALALYRSLGFEDERAAITLALLIPPTR
jgi:ribosomal protein S18 acetylase RimI-like enzyme